MSLKHIIGPTGGLSYHWIASRHANTRWRSFRAQVRQWLTEWQKNWPLHGPNSIQELVIFGPSAGWTLPLDDFHGLSKVTFVEPDPLARFLLKKRFGKKPIEILSDSKILPWFSENTEEFKCFVDSRPHAAFLFSNLLGQVTLLLSPEQAASRIRSAQNEFLNALENRIWASYHDLYSTTQSSEIKVPHLTTKAISSVSSSESTSRISEIALATFPDAKSLTDHETSWLSVNRPTEFAIWPLSRNQTHLIGFVKQV